jgi:hypothetical protein
MGFGCFRTPKAGRLNLDLFAREVIRPALRKAKIEWKAFQAGRRGLGTTLRSLTGNSTAGRDVLGHATTQITEGHYEHRLPEDALRGMRLLEAKVKVEN